MIAWFQSLTWESVRDPLWLMWVAFYLYDSTYRQPKRWKKYEATTIANIKKNLEAEDIVVMDGNEFKRAKYTQTRMPTVDQ